MSKETEIEIRPFELPKKLDWRTIQDMDIAYFERPHSRKDVEDMVHLKRQGVPIWADYDDNLFDIQPENPAFTYYGDKEKEGVHKACQVADIVTVSTQALVDVYRKDAIVVRNALRADLLNLPIKPRDNYIVWRGGLSHSGDLYEHWEQVKGLSKDYQILLLGGVPDFAKYEAKTNQNLKIVPPMRLEDYFHFLHTISPKCFIVPLSDNKFNHGKSNIAYLEALMTGAMTVAPDWEEWNYSGVNNYGDICKRPFSVAAREIMNDDGNWTLRAENGRFEARHFYQEENMKRVEIIRTLACK